MKKSLTLLIFVLCSWFSALAQFSGSGSGTSSDPYKIYNPDQLSQVRNFLSTSGVYFKLMNDIDLGDWISENYPSQGWQPIGSNNAAFQGVFDGNGKSITNFSINRSSASYVGFFGYTDGATIKNLTISGTAVKGGDYTGSLIGYSKSTTISNYTYTGNVTSSSFGGGVAGYISGGSVSTLTVNSTVTGTNYVGGLFGQAGGQTITNATLTGAVSGTGYLGGAIGKVGNGTLTLTSCTVNAPVTGTSNYVGGIIGQSSYSTSLSSCSQSGSLKGKSYMGGIDGYASGTTTFSNCEHTGDINAGGSNIGGVLGVNNSGTLTIKDCNTTGDIKNGTNDVGGIIGCVYSTSILRNCKHIGNISGTYHLGGTVGSVQSCKITIEGCHSDGNITGTTNGCIGGVCGLLKNASGSSITSSSSWGDISGGTYLGGIVGYIQRTNVSNSIDFTSTIKAGEFIRKHNVKMYLDRTTNYKYNYYKSNIYDSSGNPYYFYIVDKASNYPWTVTETTQTKQTSSKLFTTNQSTYTIYGGENISFSGYSDYSYHSKTVERTVQPNFSGNFTANVPNYAGNGVFYLNVCEESSQKTETNIKNCSSVGNITSSNSGNYLGGVVGKDESAISSYTKSSSSSYYYYPYDSDELEDIRIEYYNINYKVKYPKLESVTLSRYTRTFDITNIEESYFSGSINGGNYVGGIAGHKVSGSVNRNYSNATIYGSDYVGGLVGRLEKNANDSNPTSFDANVAMNPSVSVTGSNAGRVYGSKDANFSIAALGTNYENRVIATSTLYKNGVVQTVSDNLQNGTAVGISQLRYKANYVAWGWNFSNNWKILETESFPYKDWQTAPPSFNGKLKTGATSISGKSVDGGTVTIITTGANNTYTTTAPNNSWTVNLSTGLNTNELVKVYAQKSGLEKSYINTTSAGAIGFGTPEDPYLIYTAYDLAGITQEGNYKLMNDIDLTSWINENSPTTGWPGVGISSVSDSLVFEGDGHKITGLWSNSSTGHTGLFTKIPGSNSVIRNLEVEDVNISCSNSSGTTGGLVGQCEGKIENCSVTGSVNITGGGNSSNAGLLAGTVSSTITNCSVTGSVNIASDTGGINVGLLAGSVAGIITNCSANGTIQGLATYEGLITGLASNKMEYCEAEGSITGAALYMGGLAGLANNNISFCSAEVTLTNSSVGSNQYTGGLCGKGGNIHRCKANGIISGPRYAGGLAGYSEGVIQQSLSSGSVSSDRYAGGIAGYANEVQNCYSTSDVTSTGTNHYAGGVVGLGKGTIQYCYATGNVSSGNVVAGIVGYLNGSAAKANYCVAINNQVSANSESGYAMRVIGGYTNGAADPEQNSLAYKDMAVSINNVAQRTYDDPLNGTATEMSDLKTQSTYSGLGWNFSSVWYMNGTTGYPDLIWNKSKSQQTISLTAIPTMTYGDEAYTLPAVTDQGQSLTWSCSQTNVANISGNTLTIKGSGTALVTATQDGNASYYDFSQSYILTVKKASLTIAADNQSRQEGESNPDLTISYNGFVNGDDENSLTTLPTIETSATESSPVGSYPITVYGAATDNYDITYVNGTLTIVDESALNNRIEVASLSMSPDSETQVSINLENKSPIIMAEFYMQLPDGLEIAVDEDGYYMAELNSIRNNRHSLEVGRASNGIYHFLCYSNSNNSLNGNSGELINFTLVCNNSVESGTYTGKITNILLSDENKNAIEPADITFEIEVSDYTLGDVNGDGRINGLDIVEIVDKIMERPSDSFIFKAGDFDNNGVINGMDLVEEVSLVMSQTISGAKARKVQEHIHEDIVWKANLIKNGTGSLSVGMDNAEEYILSQFVLELGEGQTLKNIKAGDESHIVSFRQVDSNRFAVVCYSLRNDLFKENTSMVDISYEGTGTVRVCDMMLVDSKRQPQWVGNAEFDEATGINLINGAFPTPTDIYSISGALIRKNATSTKGLGKGIYVVNGKTIIIK